MVPSAPAVDEAAARGWVARILAAPNPADMLLRALEELDTRQDLETQAAVFESVAWRIDIRHYWVCFRMTRVYAELGRGDAGFFTAALAVQMQPEQLASEQPFRHLLTELARRDAPGAALDVFARHVALFPERPIAEPWELARLRQAVQAQPALPQSPLPLPRAMRREHRVIEADKRSPTPVRAVLGPVPRSLRRLAEAMHRAEIDVSELPDATLLLCNDTAAVLDAEGALQPDLSVAGYPELIAHRVREPPPGNSVEDHETAEAVLLLDAFPPPNLCHFLLDQSTRLALYRRAGVNLSRATVIGPALRSGFQQEIARRAGVRHYLGTDRIARVSVGRLWVSGNCRALQHPAHFAAPWAVEHARSVLGGRGAAGSRRLYLSRADAGIRRVLNEEALLPTLARHGFEVIVPGRMSYDAQLAAFRDASHIVAPHGAALAHLVLCPPGAQVLELFHPLYGTWSYAVLAAGCGLDYAAHSGRDGPSDAPEMNDPERTDLPMGRFGERHIRVDPAAIEAWMSERP